MPITFFVVIPDASREISVTQALAPFVTFWQALEANRDKLVKLNEQLIRQLHQQNELQEQLHAENGNSNGGNSKD